MPRRAAALALSTHPGPAVAVSAIAVILGIGVGLEPWRCAVLGLAILVGQASVGLSNDWIDADRDRASGRADKPVARGDVGAPAVRTAAFATAILGILVTVPLGWRATAAHLVFVISAWTYNAGLKSTPLSVLPYLVSFGLLPTIVTLSAPDPALASPSAVIAGALLGVAAHFANVLPDLDDDRATGVRGLAHRFGPRVTGLIIAAALAGASVVIVFGRDSIPVYLYVGLGVTVLLAIGCVILVLREPPSRLVFRLIIAAAFLDVLLLALSGPRLLA